MYVRASQVAIWSPGHLFHLVSSLPVRVTLGYTHTRPSRQVRATTKTATAVIPRVRFDLPQYMTLMGGVPRRLNERREREGRRAREWEEERVGIKEGMEEKGMLV